jgi:cell wall-associated NlpC family hydrolase
MMNRLAIIFLFVCASLFAFDVESDIVARSQTYIGCAYRTGGTKPPEFDCSGFVGFIVRPYVPRLPRLSRDMADSGTPVAKDALLPGDLVFFATTEVPGAISHVALYLGNGSIVHAISDGPERGVRVTPLEARYWKTHYQRAVRVLPESTVKPEAKANEKTANAATENAAKQTPEPAATKSKEPEKRPKNVETAKKPSPWDTWNGYVKGDYDQWKAEQQRKLEAQEMAYDKDREMGDFEAWKKANGE